MRECHQHKATELSSQRTVDVNQRIGRMLLSGSSSTSSGVFTGVFAVFRLGWFDREISRSSFLRRPLNEYDRSWWKLTGPPARRVKRTGDDGGKNEGRRIERNSSSASDGSGDLQRNR